MPDLPLPDLPLVASPGAERCWHIMTGLHIATRVEAIDYLWSAAHLPRLSIQEIRSLVEAFPAMPANQTGRPT
jgi:hypothetical protein